MGNKNKFNSRKYKKYFLNIKLTVMLFFEKKNIKYLT